MARFNRHPGMEMQNLLAGPLAALARPRVVTGLRADLQFRENDAVQLYCGHASLLRATPVPGGFRLTAHDVYSRQRCAKRLFRTWALDESGFEAAIDRYLDGVKVNKKFTAKEGMVQSQWMSIRSPWVPVDREAALGYDNEEQRTAALEIPAVAEATEAVSNLCREQRWATLKALPVRNKVDQLGVDSEGQLILVELKYGPASGLYQAPLQVLRYVWEWHGAIRQVLDGVRQLVDTRRCMEQIPADTPDPSAVLRPVLAVGIDRPSPRVLRRLGIVLDDINTRLPEGVRPIETWALDEQGQPEPLYMS